MSELTRGPALKPLPARRSLLYRSTPLGVYLGLWKWKKYDPPNKHADAMKSVVYSDEVVKSCKKTSAWELTGPWEQSPVGSLDMI